MKWIMLLFCVSSIALAEGPTKCEICDRPFFLGEPTPLHRDGDFVALRFACDTVSYIAYTPPWPVIDPQVVWDDNTDRAAPRYIPHKLESQIPAFWVCKHCLKYQKEISDALKRAFRHEIDRLRRYHD